MHSPALLEMILVYEMACDELDSDSYIQLDSIEEMNQIVMFSPALSTFQEHFSNCYLLTGGEWIDITEEFNN